MKGGEYDRWEQVVLYHVDLHCCHVIQCFMWFVVPQIKAFQQPFQLFSGQCAHRVDVVGLRPPETLLFQAFLPQAEAVAMPVQYLETGSAPIDEHEQGIGKRIHLEFLLDDGRQPVDLFSEVDRITMQIHRADGMARMHQRTEFVVADTTRASQSGSGSCGNSRCTLGPSVSVQAVLPPVAWAVANRTGTSCRLDLVVCLKRLRQ